jgi:predicted phage-related endonuclease
MNDNNLSWKEQQKKDRQVQRMIAKKRDMQADKTTVRKNPYFGKDPMAPKYLSGRQLEDFLKVKYANERKKKSR